MLVYNTQLHKKVELTPIEPGKIRMYVCGPTVYDQIHVGNGRTFLAFDVIRRYLMYKGYQVTFAQNLTDVDDKIIKRANEQGRTSEDVASEFSDAFIEQMHRMGVLDPDIRPRATQEIEAMIEMISGLIEQGHAYAPGNGDVYFSVRSDPSYGTVSGRNIDELKVGARIEANEEKDDPLDFALWKAAKPGEPMWDSPWGKGRGQDLQFPHHENEYAQAMCCWHEPLANVWMHSGMLLINGEKMSKSLGNFYTLKEVLDKYPADAVRLLMLQTHYRSPLDFSFDRLDGAVGTLERVRGAVANLRWAAESSSASGHELNDADRAFGKAVDDAAAEFTRQMDDDFNTAGALAALFGLVTASNTYLDEAGANVAGSVALRASDTLVELLGVLGVESVRPSASELPHEIVDLAREQAGYEGDDANEAADALVAARAEARAAKNWGVADAIRDGIAALGLVVEDTAAGTRIKNAQKED